MTEEERKERTFGFIGLLAVVLYRRGIKIHYQTLSEILDDKLNDKYDAICGGMVQGVIWASYRMSEKPYAEKVCKAIDCVYVNAKDETIQRYKELFGEEVETSKVFNLKTYNQITDIVDITYKHWEYYHENSVEAVAIL